ncbi:MAG: DUF6496 domain-containing protein [candidate division WOR-3 bacterium]
MAYHKSKHSGKKLKGQAKVHVVMREFAKGRLHSSSGKLVKSRKQAIAIALSEAGLSKPKHNPSLLMVPSGGKEKPVVHVNYEIPNSSSC